MEVSRDGAVVMVPDEPSQDAPHCRTPKKNKLAHPPVQAYPVAHSCDYVRRAHHVSASLPLVAMSHTLTRARRRCQICGLVLPRTLSQRLSPPASTHTRPVSDRGERSVLPGGHRLSGCACAGCIMLLFHSRSTSRRERAEAVKCLTHTMLHNDSMAYGSV